MIDLLLSLKEYKTITNKIIECIDNDSFDDLEDLFNKRESIISLIDNANFNKAEVKQTIEKLNMVIDEEVLNSKILEKRKELLEKISSINKNKIANQSYYKNNYEDALLFNKKI